MNDIERIKRSCKKLAGFEPSDEDIEALDELPKLLSKNAAKRLEEFDVTIKNLNQEGAP